jgi:HEPN domain-containing protein
MASGHDLARELLERAADDLAAAHTLFAAQSVSDAMIGFHCQQTVEKALKAVLADRGTDFPFTHDLGLLVELCREAGDFVPESLAGVDALTPFGVRLRYSAAEDGVVEPEVGIRWAEDAFEWARHAVEGSR